MGGIVGQILASYQNNSNIRYNYNAAYVSSKSRVGGVYASASGSYLTNTNNYYEVTMLRTFTPLSGYVKPSDALGGQGLDKATMFNDQMLTRGFNLNTWTFKEIEGNYAYFPQLKYFAENANEHVVNDSIISTRTNPFTGDGTKESPYLIRNVDDMVILSHSISHEYDALGKYYIVAPNVFEMNLVGTNYKPIGQDVPFKGHFDGDYTHFIIELDMMDKNYVGLFGQLSSGASISNLSVSGTIKGNNYVGGVAGKNDGQIENVYAKVHVTGNQNVGGLVGYNKGSLDTMFSTGNVTGSQGVGGLVGFNEGTIHEGYYGGRIHGQNHVGALVGFSSNELISNLNYNGTIIYYDDILDGFIKPNNAVGNLIVFNHFKVEKEALTGIEVFSQEGILLSNDLWKLSPTNGLYDYYPQLKSFAEHASSVVRTNALLYTSVIRFANGSGSKSNPYIIRHEADMKALSDITKSNNLDGIYFKVIDGVSLLDLTIEGLGFERIGHSASINQQFKGGFDGNGVTIQIELLKTTTDYLGLFGYLGQNAEVKNIEITGKVHGRNYVGALAGEINGASISNIFNHAEVLGTRYVGGLIGLSTNSNINNIYNMANVTAISRDIGGIIGFSQTSTISKVFNFGHIKGVQVVGGIVGYLYNANNVSYVYNRGMVEGTTTATYIGGITGAHRNGQISQGYSAGVILGKNTGYLGGLIGRIEGTTFESDIYYDASIIDSIVVPTGYNVPIQSIGNKLNQEHIKGLSKTEIVGLKGQSNMTLDSNEWVFIETNGVEAFYPQLKVFSTHLSERVQKDSIESVKSYVFVGEGSFDVPYVIVNKYDMEILSNLVSSGIDFEGIYFKVKEDVSVIDLTYEVNYKPIGSIATQFKGSFDGTHTNFVVKMNTSSNYQGLFGYLGDTAHVKNLSVSGSITGNNFVGSIAGVNYGVIENVFTTADLVGKDNVGGITGSNHGEVRVSYAIGSVRGNEHIGGISGNNTGIISDGYASSNIYGTSYVGGIVGSNASELYNLYYNESKIEVSPDITGYSKPFIATGNQGNTDSVYGVVSHKLYSGTLVFENEWTFENSVGFYAYYPQIKGFSKSIYKPIKDYSKDSVTISKFNEGSGTFEDPYIIRTHYDMESVSQMIGARYSLLNTYFKVASDVDYIDLTLLDIPYVPIGNSSVNFQGSFDGQGVKFNINLNNNFEYQGLFGVIGSNGYVKNVSVEGSIKGTNFIGGISGRNYGIIENSYNLAHITGTNYIGGISGYANHDIINTFNTGNIQSTGVYVGGITGGIVRNRMIKNAYNVGNIHSTLSTSLRGTGGIAGYLGGNLYNVYQASPITSERSGYISGLYGRTDGVSVIENAYFAIEPILNDTSGYFKPSTIGPNAVYKNQLTSEQLFVTFETGVFVSRQSQAFDAFYPQLKVFETSSKSHITTDSRNSVMHPLLYGEGTSINPYLIYSSYDLRGLGIAVKDGLDTIDQVYKVYQDAIIDFEPIKNLYEPIGTYSNPFKATFDGSNQTINLKIENPNKDYQGLFGVVSEDALIKDLLLEGEVQGKHYVGALAGRLNGVVSNIYIKDMVVTGHDYVGLLAGDSQITELLNISLKGVVEGLSYVGGMIGHSQTITANATYFMGSIYASSNYVGGLIGYIETESILTNVFSSGVIHASKSNYVGGLFGHFKGSLEHAYATTSITANSYAAGIAAIHEGEINEIFYSGQLSANSYAAGIVVENKGLISNAYYNSTEIENMKQLDSNKLVKHAIYNVEDSAHVSARTLSEMTFIYSLGDDITQMNFDQSLYQTKQGTDFTTYFPELYIFIDHAYNVFVEDSLESITYNKLEGLGTKLNPYLIYDGYDMMIIGDYVRDGHEFVGKYFEVAPKVTQIDLTLEDLGYTPIGSNEYNFGGIFDGKQARFIIELSTNSEYLGIFHTIGETAKVSNMVITGNIRGHAYLGGLAGRNLGTIENIYNHAHITSTLGNDIGGIVGFNQGTIKRVTNQGKITSNGSYTGGITGQNDGVIMDAYNRNDVTGFSNVAGITGHNMGEISNSYNSGHILAKDSIAAGIAGTNSSIIYQVFNSGQIIATNQNAAGIVGNFSAGNLSEAYNAGMILSKKGQAAGIVAYMNTGSISSVYQFGEIYSVEDIGIIIGFIENGNLSSIYYDIDVTNQSDLSGYKKPQYPVGNKTSDVRTNGLYHGQMIGMHALSVTNMNLANPNKYKMLPSLISTSFYPQFTVFSNSSFDYVREDSLKSVETHTFIVGDGSMVNPYLIRNESDWLALADSTTNGNSYKGVYFEVSSDIDELNFVDHPSNYKFAPVGTKDKPFSGILDGKGINVRVHVSNQLDYQALFGHIGTTGEVRNISVSGHISGRNSVSGIAAINDGVIENVYNQAVIVGNQYVAGIAATNNGVIKNVYNKGKVTGSDYVAGLTAYLNGTLYNSYNTGVIYGKNHIGMLVGFYHTGSIHNSYFDVTLLGAYRNTTTHTKPLGAVGSSFNGDNVKGLDHRFMIGQNVFGASSNQMNFVSPLDHWSTNYNLNELNENYPQLKVFAQDSRAHIQALSKESTYNRLYTVTFEELNETTNENLQYVLDNEHYQLYVQTYFGYNFLGWYYDQDGIEIQLTNKSGQSIQVFNEEKDIEVYAKWEEAYHLVQFIDGNNKVIHEEEIRHGQYVQQPDGLIPLKNKNALYVYEYMRWIFDFNGTQILKPTQIRAEYHQMDRYYTINYYDGDGHLFERQKGEYNQYIQPTSKIPTKTYDTYAYHFEGWDYNFNVVITESMDIHPIFTPVQRYYEIKFYNFDGMHIETKMGEYLFSVEPPSVLPIKAQTPEFKYEFSGWDKDISSITTSMDVIAQFKEVRRSYTVNFFNGDGSILSSQQVLYGDMAAHPSEVPTQAPAGNDAYKFDGWIEDYAYITENLNVRPKFIRVDRYYEVSFYDAFGKIIDKVQVVEYLNSAVQPINNPTKPSSVSEIYTFDGWDQDFTVITGNLEIYPVFKSSPRTYQVTFMIDQDTVYKTVETEYGKTAILPEGIPFKEGTKEIGYKFISWGANYKNITSDTLVYANYQEVAGQYLITFTDGATILNTQYVLYGKDAVAPDLTTYLKDHPNQATGYEYYFISWSSTLDFITAEKTINLNKGSRLISYEVTLINGDETTKIQVGWGQNVTFPVGYKTSTNQIKYTFVGWDNNGLAVKENRTIKALFDETYLYYEVRFYDKFNNLIKLQEVAPGSNALAPAVDIIDQQNGTLLIFNRWDKDFTNVEENLNVYAIYDTVNDSFTVNFYDAFNKIISSQIVKYNEAATEPNAPSKIIDGPYAYEFIGWSEDFSNVKSNLDIYPEYEEKEITFTVNFFDGDNRLIKTDYVKYGLDAIAPSVATKTPTQNIFYIFDGWKTSYSGVTKNLDIEAKFIEVPRYYTVNFFDKDDNIINTQIIEYGQDAKDPRFMEGFNPIISYLENDQVLVISGWDQDLINVRENRTIYALYSEVNRYYEVRFYDALNNQIGDTQIIEYGSKAFEPTTPIKVSPNPDFFFLFTGWSEPSNYVTENLEIYPTYNYVKTTYQVTFLDGNGNVFDEQTISYGQSAITPNGIPSKTPTDDVSYVFKSWDVNYDVVTSDLIVRPIFDMVTRQYLVIFKNDKGIIIKEELVNKGSSAKEPDVPILESDNYYHYMIRWSVKFDNVTEDIVTELYYEKIERIYTLTFYDYDTTTIISTITATYGQVIMAPSGPIKPADRQFSYEFISWNPVFNEVVTSDENYYPYYEEHLRVYIVTFLDGNGNVFDEQEVYYGATPKMPLNTPTKDPNKQYYYTFRMWETLTVKVYEDITIKAIFYNHLQEYEVTFIDEFGHVIEKQMVKYGEGAVEPNTDDIPVKSSTTSTVYVFSGWDKTFSFITEDLIVQTQYLGTPRKFIYTFYDDDQTTILKQIVGAYGDPIIEPNVVNKPGGEGFDYAFDGWDKVVPEILTEHMIFVARYKEVYKEYKVTLFDGNGALFKTLTVLHGQTLIPPTEIPSKLPTMQYTFVFSHWVIKGSTTVFNIFEESVTQDIQLEAAFNQEIRLYVVTYMSGEEVHEEVIVPYNGRPIIPSDPEKPGYRFTNWDKHIDRVTGDMTVHAVFVAGRYNIIFNDGYNEGDEVIVEGSMTPMTVNFDDYVVLTDLGYVRKGYDFMGWIVDGNVLPSYGDGDSFTYNNVGSLVLTAYWQPISYGISYDLNGGLAINPTMYTIEDYIRFNQANKNGYKFVGWYMVEQDETSQDMRQMSRRQANILANEDLGTYIEEIKPNTVIGSIKLTAVYEYDSYIKLKPESMLGMFHAEVTSVIPIEERNYYDETNPIYLMGVFQNQTWANLKENFVNKELYFLDKNGKELTDQDIVASGRMIVIKDSNGNITDRVHVVLKGDINGDGRVNVMDQTTLINHLNRKQPILLSNLLAADTTGDGKINVLDQTALINHLNSKTPFWDKNQTTTMNLGE
ncbi:dockerin type I repeat-containing protein [Acholeplasma laidlawii]|uniref:dockerin type I repeat-containing protein n=1 Tax=Acholeplasma laidlawii TaxID=2148 RepID=UPI001ABAFF95|nr:dockerin type I repeat-containing protein [Acholeplasma laidlawii]